MIFHATWGSTTRRLSRDAYNNHGTRQRRRRLAELGNGGARQGGGDRQGGARQWRRSAKAVLGKAAEIGSARRCSVKAVLGSARRCSAKAVLGKGGARQRRNCELPASNAYELLRQVHTASRVLFLIVAFEKGLLNHGLCFG
jgi:hypothetical protein